MIPILTTFIIILSLVLIRSADLVVVAIRRISKKMKASNFTVAALVLALGTSFPELFVGITSAIEQKPNLSLGVVVGSNVANISLIASTAALFTGRVHVYGDYLKRDVAVAFVAGILPVILVLDKYLGTVDGLVLISMYFAYATGFFKKRFEQIGREQQEESFFYRFIRKVNHVQKVETREFAKLFVGIALLLASSDLIVKSSVKLAEMANIPLFVIGLIVIALGTSLPELAFSFKSLSEHEPQMFFGNLLGSIIANSTLVIGITALIRPIQIVAFNEYLTSIIYFVAAFLTFWFFIKSKHRLDRWEAGMLLSLYLSFMLIELF